MLLLPTPTAPGSLPSESHACGHPEDLCYRVTTTPNSTSHDAPQREMKPHRGKSAGTTLPLSTTAPLGWGPLGSHGLAPAGCVGLVTPLLWAHFLPLRPLLPHTPSSELPPAT